MSDAKFSTGAVRSADADKFSFTSLPMIGLLALARTAGEGAEKYGRFNYLQGLPIHDLLDHVFKHLVMYNAGDRSETHLAHAAWGLLVAVQEEVLRPDANSPHMLGAGCSITPAMQAHMDEQKPILAANRAERGPDAFTWNIFDLADVRKLRDQRDGVNATLAQLKVNDDDRKAEYAKAVKAALKKYIKNHKPFPRTVSHVPLRPLHPTVSVCEQNENATGFVTYPEMDGETTQSVAGSDALGTSTPGGFFPVKQHKAGGNPEAFDYYDPNTKTTKTKLDHQGGCPPL